MPWCSQCGSEFRPEYKRCSDCDVELTAEAPVRAAPEMVKLVTVAAYDSEAPACILASRLEAQGIETVISDAETVTADPLWSVAIGGIKVQVRESDAQKAMEIAGTREAPAQEGEDGSSHRCPYCNSDRTCKEGLSVRAAFLSILLLGFPLLFRSEQWKCAKCCKRFEPSQKSEPVSGH